MQTKQVGYILIGFAFVIGIIIYIFNRALTDIVNSSCSHGTTCPMWGTIDFQTNVGLGLLAILLLLGIYLAFFYKELTKADLPKQKLSKEDFKDTMKTLSPEENSMIENLIDAEGAMFQSDLVEKSGFQKVKVTRLLDRLEGLSIIERRRRGMTNIVLLKLPQKRA
jgi:uncharacterized membrane protein